jgi:hypothetical protein
MKFKITYASGLVEEVDSSDVETLDGFINVKFGISAAEVADHGTIVEVAGEPVAETTAEPELLLEEPAV